MESHNSQVVGTLKITVKEAHLTHDTELFGQMSPYVKFNHRDLQFKTSIQHGEGQTPKWKDQQSFDCPITQEDTEIKFRVKDKDLLG